MVDELTLVIYTIYVAPLYVSYPHYWLVFYPISDGFKPQISRKMTDEYPHLITYSLHW